MTNQLTAQFQGLDLSIIDHAGQKWLTAEQTGLALGYNEANARQGINNLYNRHADEFTEQDSTVINLMTVDNKLRDVRVFSATGCQLLGFFSNTARAKQFRQWAKQVLANQSPAALEPPPRKSLSGRVLVTRHLERQALEWFVAGWRQVDIARKLGVSPAVVNLLVHAKYQFTAAAGAPECTPELLAAVAERHLVAEQEKLIVQQQRIAQRLCHTANNRELAEKLDGIGKHLQQPLPQALSPLNREGGAQ